MEEPIKAEVKKPVWSDRNYVGFDGFTDAMDSKKFIMRLRELYMNERFDENGDKKSPIRFIVDSFNALPEQAEKKFFPNPRFLKKHTKDWEKEALERMKLKRHTAYIKEDVAKQMALAPDKMPEIRMHISTDSLEVKTETLADRLIGDAETEMDRADEEDDPEIRVKQKTYALNVYNLVTRSVHKRRELDLKGSAEKRNQAGFILDLVNRALTGKMTPEAMGTLRASVATIAPVSESPVAESDDIEDDGAIPIQ